jgi:hypothetical protein
MALSALHVHCAGRPYTALVMAPPNIVGKWCRKVLITIPDARVFTIDGLRTPGTSNAVLHSVNEVRYRNGRIIREGLHTTLTDLSSDFGKNSKSARDRWQKICSGPSFWIIGRDRDAGIEVVATSQDHDFFSTKILIKSGEPNERSLRDDRIIERTVVPALNESSTGFFVLPFAYG